MFPSSTGIPRLLRTPKFEGFFEDRRLEQGLTNMLEIKVYICCKTLANCIRVQKSAFKKQNQGSPKLLLEKIIGELLP